MTPETQNVEWKRSWRDEYIAWICGFANAQGGVLEIGKDDRGEVVGVTDVLSLMEDIPNKVRSLLGIVVEVNLRSDDAGLEYIEIVVEPHTNPISYRGKVHYRSGSTKQVLEGAALTRFLLEKHGRSWDDLALPGVSLADLDGRILDEYRHRGVENQRLPPQALNESDESVIERLRLRDGAHLKRAAVLLFHPEPHRFFMEASVKIGAFRGAELLYQDVIEGDLFTQVDRVMDLLYTKYSRGLVSYNDIYRVETFPVPRAAMREAVVNAVVHRDYATPASTQIRVYDDRITLRNAAQLPPDWTAPVSGGLQSRPHNPRAAHGFYRAGMIEAWGRGIRRIGEFCREAGNPGPVWALEPGGVLCLRFPFSEAYQAAYREAHRVGSGLGSQAGSGATRKTARGATHKTTRKGTHKESGVTQKTAPNDTRRRIVALVRDNPRITQAKIAERLGITRDGVAYHFRQLQGEEVIRRIGSRKHGHWEVLDETEAAGDTTQETTQETTHKTTHKESGTTQETAPNDIRRRIMDLMRNDPQITQTRIAERLGITRDGVAYHFRQLQADRVIRRIGSRKHGHWEVLGP